MPHNLPLDNQILVRPLMLKVAAILEENRDRINAVLANYRVQRGAPATLGKILIGRRPKRNIREQFPNIVVISTTRSPEWSHQKTTKETVTLRLFCNVLVQDDDTHEYMMTDLTDVVESILMQNPVFYWTGYTGDPPQAITYMTSTSVVVGVSYGTIDDGNLKSGQIDWGCEVLVPWENIEYYTGGVPSRDATHLVFAEAPPATVIARTPFAVQPVVLAKNLFEDVDPHYAAPVSLAIKAGTAPAGVALRGTTTLTPSPGGVCLFSGLDIDTPVEGVVLQATSGTLTVAETAPMTVLPKPDKAVCVLPEGATVGVPFSVTVEVRDNADALCTGYSGLCVLAVDTTSGGAITGEAFGGVQNGTLTLTNLTATVAGTYTLTPTLNDVVGQAAPLTVA